MQPQPDRPSPWALVLSGLPGVGKTTLARAVFQATGARHLRVDTVETALTRSQAKWQGDLADAGYQVIYALAAEDLARGTSVILDCVNPIPLTRNWFDTLEARVILRVELLCSDPTEHRHRVETRTPDLPGQTTPNWAMVQARTYEPWETADLRLDTAQLAPAQVVDLLLARLAMVQAKPPKGTT